MEKKADLHIHTHFSDGNSSPEEVVEQAYKNNISCIAITDHDTLDGIEPTIEAARQYDIEVIAGVELSTEANGKDVHVLGYFLDYKNKEFIERLRHMQDSRLERMQKMIEKLKALGINNISLDEVCGLAESDSVGRPHLATILKEKGMVSSIQMAFNKYLAEGQSAYIPKFKQTPKEAIELIRQTGGVAVLAHPMLTCVDELIAGFVRAGLGGMEVYYPNVSEHVTLFYEKLAKKYDLVATGGSDAHGTLKKHTYIGKKMISYGIVEQLKARKS